MITKSSKIVWLAGCLVLTLTFCLSCGSVDHPSKLTYKPIVYNPPNPADYREELASGMVVYIMEDHLLPTLDVGAIIRTGSLYDPKEKAGLAAMTGAVMRTGGTKNIKGDELDERLAFLGGSISTSIAGTSGNAGLSVLIRDADEGLKLFADVLMHPAFEAEKIKLFKDKTIHGLKNKNSSPKAVLDREFNKLLYGDHPLVREKTQPSIEGITPKDLLAFHEKYFSPNNIILTVAGDFERAEMLKKIEATFADWPKKTVDFPKIPDVEAKNRPGVFMIQKEVNQGYFRMGHFGIKDTNPDVFALDIMNFILGSGSFTARIVTKVRSNEGLAYNTGSRFWNRHLFPGTFSGYAQTKSATVHYAISLIQAEFERIQTETVTEDEMETAKQSYLDSFPNLFTSPSGTLRNFAKKEYDGFPMDYYQTYRDKYKAVTKADVLRVAKQYIRPDQMSIFVVGDIPSCKAGYDKHPGTLDEFGEISVIELKDPLTGL